MKPALWSLVVKQTAQPTDLDRNIDDIEQLLGREVQAGAGRSAVPSLGKSHVCTILLCNCIQSRGQVWDASLQTACLQHTDRELCEQYMKLRMQLPTLSAVTAPTLMNSSGFTPTLYSFVLRLPWAVQTGQQL